MSVGFSSTPSPRASARRKCTLGRKASGRICPPSKRPSVMRASSAPSGRRYSRAISFSFSIHNVTAGYRCRVLLAFLPFLPVIIARSLSRQGIVETLIENTDEANLTLFSSWSGRRPVSANSHRTVCRFCGHARAARRRRTCSRIARHDGDGGPGGAWSLCHLSGRVNGSVAENGADVTN